MGQLIKLTKFDIRLNTLYYLSLRAPSPVARDDPKIYILTADFICMIKKLSSMKIQTIPTLI